MNTSQAISELKNFLSFKKSSDYAEELLKKLELSESQCLDAEKARDKANLELKEASEFLVDIEKNIDLVKKQHDEIISNAKKVADEIIQKANNDSVAIQEDSQRKLDVLGEKIQDAKARFDVAESETIAAINKLNEINKALNEAKEKAQKLLG